MEPGTLEQKIAKLPEDLKRRVELYVNALIDSANPGMALSEPEVIYQISKAKQETKNPEPASRIPEQFGDTSSLQPKKKREFGSLKGFVTYMADDFNAPMEEFKDYM